ncbi:type II toxin-antitoxin system RelE/ParE family toxin [Cupriavidus pauculus]|uniref:Type II toxin-antitoxin system RelE/ParE family toxin n=2 Tax=Cupriavidus pauculus TaxID=82633 RepID=A0A5P2HAB2_9BURK|nr:type II toxin-antitoxin system RelE/ParE family toxin [Cupriavidus pauculus]
MDAFGMAVWEESYAQIQASIQRIREFPECGPVADELSTLTAERFREVQSGKNRIIYEVRDDTIYVHLIVDRRRDLTSLLQRILLHV